MRYKRFRAVAATAAGVFVLAAVALTGGAASADSSSDIQASFESDSVSVPAHASSSRTLVADPFANGPQVNPKITFDFSGLAGVATASLPPAYGCITTGSTAVCPITMPTDPSADLPTFDVTVTALAGAANGAAGTIMAVASADGDAPDTGVSATVTVFDTAELDTLNVDVDQDVSPGDAASMSLTFANLGSKPAPGVQAIYSVSHGFVPKTYDNCLYAAWTAENGTLVACTIPGSIAANQQVKIHGGFQGTIAADSATRARIDAYIVTTSATAPAQPPANLFPGVTFAARPASGQSLTLDTEPNDGTIAGGDIPWASAFYDVNTTADLVANGANLAGSVGQTVSATVGMTDNGPGALDNHSMGDAVQVVVVTVPTWAKAVTVPSTCSGSNQGGGFSGPSAGGYKYYTCVASSSDVMAVGQTASFTIGLQITTTSGTNGTVAIYDGDGSNNNDPNPANNSAPIALNRTGSVANTFVPVSPARILDTRSGNGAPKARVGAASTIAVQVTGKGGVPGTGVTAVVLNVTAVNASANTYLKVFPDGASLPIASNLNVAKGRTLPNLVTVPVTDGKIDINNNAGTVDVLADVTGYYTNTGTGSSLNTVDPGRILDTRSGNGAAKAKVGPNGTVKLKVAGMGGVPSSGVKAVVMNVTAVNPSASSFVTVYPDGGSLPNASNLNFVAGQTVANLVIVPVTDGYVDLHNAGGSVDLLADVTGYFAATGAGFHPAGPARMMDTRDGTGVPHAVVGPNATVSLTVAGADGVPLTGVTAVVLNVTVTAPTAAGYLTVYPDGVGLPNVSNLNFGAGQTIANLVIVPVHDGKIDFHNATGNVQIIGDLNGYFTS